MNNILSLINSEIVILNENRQLADKEYFNTGKLDDRDKDAIYRISKGDNTTKMIADLYYAHKEDWDFKKKYLYLFDIHDELLNYNPNVYPIFGFDILNRKYENFYQPLLDRKKIIAFLKSLPSTAIRNMKDDIRVVRTPNELHNYYDHFNYFMSYYSMLGNRNEAAQKKIQDKMFKSNITLDTLVSFVEDKANLLGGVEYSKKFIEDMIHNEGDEDLSIIYEGNNVMVVKVESAEAIKLIGCNSLWCFTYGENNYRHWNDYSYNGLVYVIIDFSLSSDDERFMHTLIKPLLADYDEDNEEESPLFDMSNEKQYDPIGILNHLVGNDNIGKLFTFDYN